MKDRTRPCVYYVCADHDCMKSVKDVTMRKCQSCQKYQPRKVGNPKTETITAKKEKARKREMRTYMKEECR